MSKKHKLTNPNGKTIFEWQAEGANSVFLAGTFNDWNPQANPMRREVDGPWRAELALAPGRYEYKFVVDGEWRCEPGAEENMAHCVPNALGTMNRVIEV